MNKIRICIFLLYFTFPSLNGEGRGGEVKGEEVGMGV